MGKPLQVTQEPIQQPLEQRPEEHGEAYSLDLDLPPAYEAGEPVTDPTAQTHHATLDLGRLVGSVDFSKYSIAQSSLSSDRITVTSTASDLCTKADALIAFLREQTAVLPKPVVVITGTPMDGGNRYVKAKPIFELSLNCMSMMAFDGVVTKPNTRRRIDQDVEEAAADATDEMASWAKRFVADPAENKSFILQRKITGWDTDYIEGHIRTLIAAAKFRGNVSVDFPIEHSRVVIHKQPSSWVVSMLKIYPVKAYEVITVNWRFGRDDDEVDSTHPQSRTIKSSAVAEDWWREWATPIYNGILTKRKGWVTVEDWIEVEMGRREKAREGEWGKESDYD